MGFIYFGTPCTLLRKNCLYAVYHQAMIAQWIKTLYFEFLGKWPLKNDVNKLCNH